MARSRRSLLWMPPRRFAAIVVPSGITARRSFDPLLRLALLRLRPGGALIARERLTPTRRNQRLLSRLVSGATPDRPAEAFTLAPNRTAKPRDLERFSRMGLAVKTLPLGGELLEPILDGGGFDRRCYSASEAEELVALLIAAEKILRRFGVLDAESVLYVVGESEGPVAARWLDAASAPGRCARRWPRRG